MGGNLISKILQNGFEQAKAAKNIILQPMNDLDITRRWLYENGFEIYDEELVEESPKLYNVICASWKGTNTHIPSKAYYYVGEKLIQKKDPLLGKLLSRKTAQLKKSIHELQNAGESSKAVLEDYTNLLKELLVIENNL
jgi:tRNA (adenine22-N1)-methyltransferase